MILAIDFDNTIADSRHPKEGMKMGPPMEGAVEVMRLLKAAGHLLIVHTCWTKDRWHIIDGWMEFYKIPYDDITNVKPNADWYIDDKAIAFKGDWSRALEEVYGT